MKITIYEREVAFRAIDSKFCPACGNRRYGLRIFCEGCEKKLPFHIVKGLHNRASYPWAYYEALKIIAEART